MSETLQLKTELRTRIRVMGCADYVVSLLYNHLPGLYTIMAERRAARKSARRRWHKGADRRRGGRGLIGQVFDEADHALRRRMQLKTAGALHSRRPPTEQPKSAAWNDRPLPARISFRESTKKPF